jgi:hypothetical protein
VGAGSARLLGGEVSVKVISFTAHPDKGWNTVTPFGLITIEPGRQVTICFSDTWEEGADAIRVLREHPPVDHSASDVPK